MAYSAKVLQGNLPSSAGSTDFTSTGFGTPSGALIFLSNAITSSNPLVTGSMSVGFWDGTTALCCAAASYDNVTVTDESRSSSDSHGAIAVNPSSAGRYADYTVSSITDGIRLTIDTDNTGGSRYCSVVLFKGTTMKCVTLAANNTENGTATTSSLGIEPESAFFATIGNGAVDGDVNGRILSFGVANSSGTNRAIAWSGTHNLATSVSNTILSETRCVGQWYNNATSWAGEVTTWGTDDLTLTTRDGASGSDYVFILAADSSLTFDLGTITTPTSTGTDDVTTTGTDPSEVLVALTTGSGTTLETGSGGEGICIGVSDGTNEYSFHAWSEDNVGTSNSESEYSTNVVNLADSVGDVAVASISALGTEKFTLNYSTAPGTARKGFYVAFGAAAASGETGAGSSAGVATATGVGSATAAAAASSSGVATATAIGSSTFESVGASAGVATASASSASGSAADGSASGTATASAVGESTFAAAGSSQGTATAVADASSGTSAAGSSSGSATAAAVGAATFSADGSSSGSATATAVGASTSTGEAAGSADGISTALAVGASTAAASGTSGGTSTATAVYGNVSTGAGSADGAASATAVGRLVAAAIGVADGIAAASGVGASVNRALGTSAGVGSVNGYATGAATFINVKSASISVPRATATIRAS